MVEHQQFSSSQQETNAASGTADNATTTVIDDASKKQVYQKQSIDESTTPISYDPSPDQQQTSHAPSYSPQLKSILRQSNAPKTLSDEIHNIEDEDAQVDKMSISYNNHLRWYFYR